MLSQKQQGITQGFAGADLNWPTKETIPITMVMLTKLLPTISHGQTGSPALSAVRVRASSGRFVPMPTSTKETNSGESRQLAAARWIIRINTSAETAIMPIPMANESRVLASIR